MSNPDPESADRVCVPPDTGAATSHTEFHFAAIERKVGADPNRRKVSPDERRTLKRLRDQLAILGCMCLLAPLPTVLKAYDQTSVSTTPEESWNNLRAFVPSIGVCVVSCGLAVACFQYRAWAAYVVAVISLMLCIRWFGEFWELPALLTFGAAVRAIVTRRLSLSNCLASARKTNCGTNTMQQLVGHDCIHCGKRISCEPEARFCRVCGNAVHNACMRPGPAEEWRTICVQCGASRIESPKSQDVASEAGNHPSLVNESKTLATRRPTGLTVLAMIQLLFFGSMVFSLLVVLGSDGRGERADGVRIQLSNYQLLSFSITATLLFLSAMGFLAQNRILGYWGGNLLAIGSVANILAHNASERFVNFDMHVMSLIYPVFLFFALNLYYRKSFR